VVCREQRRRVLSVDGHVDGERLLAEYPLANEMGRWRGSGMRDGLVCRAHGHLSGWLLWRGPARLAYGRPFVGVAVPT
jgi:hypothetical protein